MSGTAGLSAARRRRGVLPTDPVMSNSQKMNTSLQPENARIQKSPGILLIEHDKKIFELEKKMSLVNNNILQETITNIPKDVQSVTKNNDTEILSKISENKIFCAQNKQNMQNMSKHIKEMNSLVVTLRANLSHQNEQIITLKNDFSKLTNYVEELSNQVKKSSNRSFEGQSIEPEQSVEPEQSIEPVQSLEPVQSVEPEQSVEPIQSVEEEVELALEEAVEKITSQESEEVSSDKRRGRGKKSKGTIKLDVNNKLSENEEITLDVLENA